MKDGSSDFIISLFRLAVYIASVVIIIPLVHDGNAVAYVSFIVYGLGKALDYMEKIVEDGSIHFFWFRLIDIVLIVTSFVICFYEYSKGDRMTGGLLPVLIMLAVTCLWDAFETAYTAVKYSKTKQLLETEVVE